MIARRLLLFVSLLLLVSAVGSVMRPAPEPRNVEPAGAARAAPAVSARVLAKLPAEQPVEAVVGDVVELTAHSDSDDRVELRDLGVSAPVGPGLAATLLVVVDRPGTFPVTLRFGGTTIGTLEVSPR